MAEYVRATGHADVDPSLYPLVVGEPDERAARMAYSTFNSLLDYRALRLPDAPFLCPVDLERGSHDSFTFAQTRRLVISAARSLALDLAPRRNCEEAKVVGLVGISGADYWLTDKAILRLCVSNSFPNLTPTSEVILPSFYPPL